MKWERVKLGDVCSIGDGAHASLKRQKLGIPYITAKNISKNGLDTSNMDFISEGTYNKHFKKNSSALTCPEKEDILYSIIGSLGGVHIIGDEKIGISSSVAIFRCKKDKILPRYLYYFCRSTLFSTQIQNIKGGVAQGFMSLSKLAGVELTIPKNLETQRRIADILSTYDDLIENNQKQIKLLEEAAERLYKEWFVDLRFPGHEETEIIDGVPEGWERVAFSTIFDFVRGKSYATKDLSDSDGVLMANLKNIQAFGGYNRNAEKRFTGKYKENQTIEDGDLIMGVTDMTKERRLVGHVALVPNMKEKMIFSMDLIKIIPRCGTKNFIYSAMRYGGISKQISVLANGTNVLHLKPESMMSLEMVIPEQKILHAYDDFFEQTRKKIDRLQTQQNVLTEARDRLLPRLMNGEIEVE